MPESNADWIYSPTDIEASDTILGRGAFGEVRIAKWRNINIALKTLHLLKDQEENSASENILETEFLSEIELLSRIRHPNIVLFIGVCKEQTSGSMSILTELLQCSLYDILEIKKITLDFTDILDISLDIANGLNYLHNFNPVIVHRDISSKNILVSKGNMAKIADLGQAKLFQKTSGGQNSIQSRQTSMPGAMAYSAPEVLTGKYSSKIDIFSFGILLTQMCCNEYPRIDKREAQISAAKQAYPVMEHMLENMISYQPSERPSAELICHELESIKSNDRYYSLSRLLSPEKDIGILSRHWVASQLETQTKEMKLSLEHVTSLYNTGEARWHNEANKVDGLQDIINDTKEQLDIKINENTALTNTITTLNNKIAELTTQNTHLTNSLTTAQNDKQRQSNLIQFYELQLAQKTNEMDHLQSTIALNQQTLQQNKNALDNFKFSQHESTNKTMQLKSQLEMQLNYARDLEGRLEQTLTRWRIEKEGSDAEVRRNKSLKSTCAELINKNDQLTVELKRCEERLLMYDDLPLPDEIKLRFDDLHSDLERSQGNIQSLIQQRNSLSQQIEALQETVIEKDNIIADQNSDLDQKVEKIEQKIQEIHELNEKIDFLTTKLKETEQNLTTQKGEKEVAQENEIVAQEFLKAAKGEIVRQKQLIAALQQQNASIMNDNQHSNSRLDPFNSNIAGNANVNIASNLPTAQHSNNNNNNNNNNAVFDPNTTTSIQDNSIASDFITTLLLNNTNESVLGVGAGNNESSMTLEEIENAESNRRSDSTVKYSIQRIADNEGVIGLLAIMRQLYNDSRVIWRSARTLRELVLQSDENKVKCYGDKVEEVLIKSLVNFAHVSVVQSHCMRLLGILAFGNDLFRRKCGEQGVTHCILSALEKHIADESVILHTLTAITNLCHNSLENRSRFYESHHGLDLLIHAMVHYKESPKVQRQACWALLTLSGSDDVCKVLSANGGDSAILNAMLTHRLDSGVQQYGCWALSNMALCGDDICRKLKKKGITEVCRIALETHAENSEVIRQAKHTLGIMAPNNHK